MSLFLAYVGYFSYLYTYERASYGHIKSAARHDGRDALMREAIDQQYAEIAKLNRNIEALNRQIRKKDETIAKLTERLSKYENPKKNSSNSSTPPSKEGMKDEIIRRTKTLRKPSGKKPRRSGGA